MSNSLEKYFQCFGDGKKLKKKLNLKQATSPICRFVFFFSQIFLLARIPTLTHTIPLELSVVQLAIPFVFFLWFST